MAEGGELVRAKNGDQGQRQGERPSLALQAVQAVQGAPRLVFHGLQHGLHGGLELVGGMWDNNWHTYSGPLKTGYSSLFAVLEPNSGRLFT